MTDHFEPNRLALVESNGETSLVALDSEDHRVGVICPPDLVPILQSFVSPSNPALVRFWKTYTEAKGDATLFWDLIGIAEGIRDLSAVPRSRRLLHFTSEADLFHNGWQARLMRLCVRRGLEVEIIAATASERRADFLVGSSMPVEIKTIFSETGVELDGEGGMRLAPPDAVKLARGIRAKVNDALGQIGDRGVVVVALWCDIAANAVCRLGGTHPLETTDLSPGTLVLALGPSEGEEWHRALTVPLHDVDQFTKRLSERLHAYTQPVFIPFCGRHVCVASGRADEWISIGRQVQIGVWHDRYAPYEIQEDKGTSPLIPTQTGELLSHMLHAANEHMAAWNEAIEGKPFEPRPYSSEEWPADARFTALFSWGAQLFGVLKLLRQDETLLAALLPAGRPRADADRLFNAMFREDGRLNTEPFLRLHRGVESMARLTKQLSACCS